MAIQTQAPNTGSLEQIVRTLELLAQAPAFGLELQQVAAEIGTGAFVPAPFLDANGNQFTLDLNDSSYGDPLSWLAKGDDLGFSQVLTTSGLRPVPPYPLLQLMGSPGHLDMQTDQTALAVWAYGIDVVVVCDSDLPQAAARRAYSFANAFDRLVKRNESLGGLVYNIVAVDTPVPGGEVETRGGGVISGVLQHYDARALRPI